MNSRGALWRKGETSGHTQRVVEVRLGVAHRVALVDASAAGPWVAAVLRRPVVLADLQPERVERFE